MSKRMISLACGLGLALAGCVSGGALRHDDPDAFARYSFGPESAQGYTQVAPGTAYAPDRGYGFDLGSKVKSVAAAGDNPGGGYATPDHEKGFFFSTKLDPGAYRVTVEIGGAQGPSETTVKSETRRLMFESVRAGAGETKQLSFLVHVRVPQIPGAQPPNNAVRLKQRESDPILFVEWSGKKLVPFTELDWDEKLTLAFTGENAAVGSVQIAKAPEHTTVYLVGDSTMADQMMEPWAAWGQMFPRWFTQPVVIANYAELGETAASFIGERRWPKLMSEVHAGDYILIQFGINDRGTQIDRFKGYFEQFIKDARAKGAFPVLVTSQNLRSGAFGPDGKAVNTLGGYPEAMREVAKAEGTPLIDLNAMSIKLYDAIGAADLPKAFVDSTHQNDYGAYELSKCIVQAAIDANLPFAKNVVADWKPFDPSHPDPMDAFKLPADPQLDPSLPGGTGLPEGVPSATGQRARPAATGPGQVQGARRGN